MPEKNNLAEQLLAPFHESEYEWRVQAEASGGSKVRVLCYVQARAIQNRLDEVCGIFGWQSEITYGPDGAVLCRLSVQDPVSKQWVAKVDGASNTDIEAVKGGISSALKRAANMWGIGRLLYKLPATTVPLKSSGEHYHKVKKGENQGKWMYWDAPPLPKWAINQEGETPKTDTPPPAFFVRAV